MSDVVDAIKMDIERKIADLHCDYCDKIGNVKKECQLKKINQFLIIPIQYHSSVDKTDKKEKFINKILMADEGKREKIF